MSIVLDLVFLIPFVSYAVLYLFQWRPFGPDRSGSMVEGPQILAFLCGVLLLSLSKRILRKVIETSGDQHGGSIYGLDHGRLHLRMPPPMWMNMGYWKHDPEGLEEVEEHSGGRPERPFPGRKTMGEACRDLLEEVLKTAGFDPNRDSSEFFKGTRKTKSLIDLGFGCGEQITYLTSSVPLRESDKEWWPPYGLRRCSYLDAYIGITLDEKQYRHAVALTQDPIIRRKREEARHRSQRYRRDGRSELVDPKLFCADAAKPQSWSKELRECVQRAVADTEERWVLALDTAYHFSPSRWPTIHYAYHTLNASFVAFDLCISSTISFQQKATLRILTSLMGAPWANFVTPDDYRKKLVAVGYEEAQITIKDISEDVFGPLAAFLEEQDRKLRVVGFSLGPFNVARLMFKWWANSGAVRGIIVVAKK